MEESCARMASDFCGELRRFCLRLDLSTRSLRASMERMPSSESTGLGAAKLLETMNQKIASAVNKVEALGAIIMEVATFEELFSHWNDLYHRNQDGIKSLVAELEQYGYKEKEEVLTLNDDSDDEYDDAPTVQDVAEVHGVRSTPAESDPELDSLYVDSLSLKDLGLSASSLAALSSEDPFSPEFNVPDCGREFDEKPTKVVPEHDSERSGSGTATPTSIQDSSGTGGSRHLRLINKDEFGSAPSWLKWQVSLELLNEFASRLDALLSSKPGGSGSVTPEDLSSLSYAPQVQKACLLLLVKLQRLETGFSDGATTYKPAKGKAIV